MALGPLSPGRTPPQKKYAYKLGRALEKVIWHFLILLRKDIGDQFLFEFSEERKKMQNLGIIRGWENGRTRHKYISNPINRKKIRERTVNSHEAKTSFHELFYGCLTRIYSG